MPPSPTAPRGAPPGSPSAIAFPLPSGSAIRLRPLSRQAARVLTMAAVVALGLAWRLPGLDAYGFSEDEIQKLLAVEGYRRLDFTQNAEHPLLMKMTMAASLQAGEAWNHVARAAGWAEVSDEAALRVANAVAGAATGAVLFLLVESLLGFGVAAWAALFWAADVNAIAMNRIGKEDTLLLLFLLLAAWLHQRARETRATDEGRAQRWYRRSGAAFGLMLASKYMPYYFGVHALFLRAADDGPKVKRPRKKRFYLWMAAAFLLANVTVLLPANWAYVLRYSQGAKVIHSGYVVAGTLYPNNIGATPWGVPAWFYAAFLATKVPLAVLAAAAAGLVPLVARRRERGYVFLRVFLVFVLVPYSLAATKFARYMLPVLAVIDILAAAGVAWLLDRAARRFGRSIPRSALAAGAALVFALPAVGAAAHGGPYYSAHQNALGRALGPPGWLCPTDEFYDLGVREMMQVVSAQAAPGAVVASDASFVVAEYARRAGRSDLRVWSMSRHGLPVDGSETWVIVQEGHRYFENDALIRLVRMRHAPVRVIQVRGGVAAELFRIGGRNSMMQQAAGDAAAQRHAAAARGLARRP